MKVAAFIDKQNIRVIDVPRPAVSDEGIVIRIRACGICGSDLHVFKEGKFLQDSSGEVAGHRVLGHEFAGDVVETGKKLKDFKEGDRVICAHVKGGFAEYLHVEKAVKDVNVFHLPDSISYRTAATLEPLFISYHSVMLSSPIVGDTAVVMGGGMVGLGIIQVLKALFFTRIVVIDLSVKRLETAKTLGAEYLINPQKQDPFDTVAEITGTEYVRYLTYRSPRADIVYECAGAPSTPAQAFKIARPKTGRVVAIALYKHVSELDLNDVVLKNIRVFGMLGFTEKHILQVIQLVDAGRIERESLITHEYPLEDIQKGFESQLSINETIKAIIRMD
jgi:threonine dehydrogenase-like Zn-dependent dehydrogenase